MEQEEIKAALLTTLTAVAPEAAMETLDPDLRFRDQFEFGSVDFLTFVTRLQDHFGIRIPETDCPRLASLSGCLAYLSSRIG